MPVIEKNMNTTKLRVSEIFHSLQGETNLVGLPTVFVRLAGCPLRCQYCDTAYAFNGGPWMDLASIVSEISHFQTPYVTVTGGEPLAQKPCKELLSALCDGGFKVSLETSGALPINNIDRRVIKIVDIKTPGSGESSKNLYAEFQYLLAHDQTKFVICDRKDYEWSKLILAKYALNNCCEVLFSPSYNQLPAKQLAEWILIDKLPVRFQIQMHKTIWGDERGR